MLRGALALRFGDLDAAEQHFRTGLEWASRPDVRFIVDQGRCHQGLAEVAERRGDLEAARAHLDAAGALFAQHGGARLYLDQVLAKKQVLGAMTQRAHATAGSTRLLDEAEQASERT